MPTQRVSTFFSKDDIWFYETVKNIVDIKKRAGWHTSFSEELIRLAKIGMHESIVDKKERKALLEILRHISNDTSQKSKS